MHLHWQRNYVRYHNAQRPHTVVGKAILKLWNHLTRRLSGKISMSLSGVSLRKDVVNPTPFTEVEKPQSAICNDFQ